MVHCPFSKEIWWRTTSWARCGCHFNVDVDSIQEWWEEQQKLQPGPKRKGFNTLFMLTGWHIWKERNARLFNRQAAGASEIVQRIKDEVDLWIAAGARKLGCLFGE
ncbi:hypothetical protein PAHAL_2G078400 [Panicum hallii]|jgi:hypothetical protein|uniref:Uncharacterized protein n=1 Tax=Panicum hallii TaxID=206008 RepID=A0A2T8KN89_9POAL|nr:hypothetical protein PAHAL_2G078400 [Panicum hallii]